MTMSESSYQPCILVDNLVIHPCGFFDPSMHQDTIMYFFYQCTLYFCSVIMEEDDSDEDPDEIGVQFKGIYTVRTYSMLHSYVLNFIYYLLQSNK